MKHDFLGLQDSQIGPVVCIVLGLSPAYRLVKTQSSGSKREHQAKTA